MQTFSNFQIGTLSNCFSHWQRKQFVYNEVKNDSSLTNDTTLNNFYTNNSSNVIGLIANVEDNIKQGDYAVASSNNNSIVPNNILEQNQQSVNDLILQKLIDTNYVYTSADVNVLQDIADQCPIAGGNAVYQARNLLMTIANDVIEFTENCNEDPKRSMITTLQHASTSDYKLYPNPNNGAMVFEYTLLSTSKGELRIYDVTGKAISNYNLTEGYSKKLEIDQTQLNNGVYFYSIFVNNKIVEHNKLIIIK